MDSALVVVDESERHRELVREAGELASGVGADLTLLAVLSEEDYESNIETIETIAEIEDISYDNETAISTAQQFAEEVGSEELADVDVDYEATAAVADDVSEADVILDTAEELGCDHVFIAGAKRSPTGKAIFGDTAQKVILNFDGYVTVLTD